MGIKIKNMKELDLTLLSSPDYHEKLGIYPRWRVGDKLGNTGMNEIYPYYTDSQCEQILDDVLGVDGWGVEAREVCGMLFMSIQIITGNGIIEKADAGGARQSRKKSITDVDKATFEAKTAATSAFVRACSRLGIGRHLNDLPKVRLKVDGYVAIGSKGERLTTPEDLSAYCNKMSPALLHLISAYNMCKSTFDGNERAQKMFSDLREIIETVRK